jgi:hypothetical protein
VEVVTAPSPRRARRQPTRVVQLRWARIWLIHRRCTTASSSRRRGGIRLGIGDYPDTHAMDIKGTRSRPGVMNPGRWRGCRSSDSHGRSLHIAGLGQPAGPRHSTALNRVGGRTPAWARLNRVEGGDSWRTGPSRTMIQDVQLEVGNVYVPTDNSNGTILQRFATLLYIRIESNRLHTRFPVHSMVITSDTISHSCGKPRMRPNTLRRRNGSRPSGPMTY